MNKHYRNRLEINLDTLKSNFVKLNQAVAPQEVMAVLKAGAYGLGAKKVASALIDAGARRLAVADLHEALELKTHAVPILILGDLIPEEIKPAIESGFELPLGSLEKAQLISEEAQRKHCNVNVHLVIDSGMGRLGIPIEQALEDIQEINQLDGLNLVGLYSHFPVAYTDRDFSLEQIHLMKKLLADLSECGINFDWIHIANSDGIQNIPEACVSPFNLVRTGLNLYGCFDLEGERRVDLQEVVSLKSRLVRVRSLNAGSTLGYGRTYKLEQDQLVGTVAIGYADGFPMSENAGVIVRGQFCLVLGRVSMDYITIDLTKVPEAQSGDDVTCIGEGISISDWARWKGTLTYEIICSLGKRVKRLYF